MNCKPLTRLLFIGMWNFADDYGRLHYATLGIKAKVFPNDSIAAGEVRDMLEELRANALLVIYTADGKEYIEITGWDHQKIDKRQLSKIPGPFDAGSAVNAGSPPIPADSRRLTPTPPPVMEGNVGEGKVDPEAKASGAVAPLDPSIPERDYFVRGREVLGKGNGALIAKLLKAKGKNVALARAALEQASQKQDPVEFIGACCRDGPIAKPLTEFQRKQQVTNDVTAKLLESAATARSSGAADRYLSDDHGQRPGNLRGGTGPHLFALSGPSGGGSNRS